MILPSILLALMFAGTSGCNQAHSISAGQARWVERQGGLSSCDATRQRLQKACESILASVDVPVRLQLLDSRSPNAWSWPSGEIYVSFELLQIFTDDEVAAVVGHELGHLISDGHLNSRLSLASPAGSLDIEANADAIGRRLLIAGAKDANAMRSALGKLAAHPATTPATRRAIERRIDRLGAL